jgi:hypothetical protein
MQCARCQSNRQEQFVAEMMPHFSGASNVARSDVMTFPMVSVCLDCGYSTFSVPEAELAALNEGSAMAPGS